MLQTFMGGFRTRPAAQESTKFRRTPEMIGRSHEDPIGDAFRSFINWATTPLRQGLPSASPRDIHRGAPADDPHNRQIVDQLGPQEQDLIGDAFEADTRSPARRWWESTEFPPVAIARGAWDTFVGQASPLDVALEAAGAGIAARGRRAPLAIGGARARPAPTTRGSESALMRAFNETGDVPFEEYGTYGKDIIDNLLRDATVTEAVEGTAGFSLADEAFRLADEALRDPDITNINTRKGNLNLPEGGSLMGRGTPETTPEGYTLHGGSLLDNALSGRGDNVDFIRTGATQRPDETIFPELDFSRQDEPFHGDDLLDELARFVGDETNPPSPVIEPSDVQKLIDEGKVRIRPDGSLQVLDESITGSSAIDDAFRGIDDSVLEFPSGVRIEKKGDTFELYDPSTGELIPMDELDSALRQRIEGIMRGEPNDIDKLHESLGMQPSDLEERLGFWLEGRKLGEPQGGGFIHAAYDSYSGFTKDELLDRYPHLSRSEIDAAYDLGRNPPESLNPSDPRNLDDFSDEALTGADEYLDLDDPSDSEIDDAIDAVFGDDSIIRDDLRRVQDGEMNLSDFADKHPELDAEELSHFPELDDALDVDEAINDLLQGATDDASIRENDAVLEAFEKVQEGNFDDLTPQDIRRVYDRDVAQEVLRDYYKGAMTESDVEETLGLSIEKLEEAFGFDFDDLLGT